MRAQILHNVVILAEALIDSILEIYFKCIAHGSDMNIAVSGGSIPKIMAMESFYSRIWNNPDIDLKKISFYLVDERNVPLDHSDSNYKAVASISPKLQIYPIIPGNLSESSKTYSTLIKERIKSLNDQIPSFDLILLGMGADGHVASIFPGKSSIFSNELVTFIQDSPKEPKERVSMTLKLINSSRNIFFIVTGYEKKDAAKAVLVDKKTALPASLVRCSNLQWFLDDLAAREVAEFIDEINSSDLTAI